MTDVACPAVELRGPASPNVGPDPRRWRALALLCLAFFMVILDSSIVVVAVPSIQRQLLGRPPVMPPETSNCGRSDEHERRGGRNRQQEQNPRSIPAVAFPSDPLLHHPYGRGLGSACRANGVCPAGVD